MSIAIDCNSLWAWGQIALLPLGVAGVVFYKWVINNFLCGLESNSLGRLNLILFSPGFFRVFLAAFLGLCIALGAYRTGACALG